MEKLSFSDRVYSLCRKIPKGQVSTYKLIGRKLDRRGQIYRAVGAALNKNKSRKIPCHRVINSNGFVGHYNKGIIKKIQLLKSEGVAISKNRKIDLKKYLFRF